MVETRRIVCPKCDSGDNMTQIGGWKEDGSAAPLRTFWCGMCKKVWAETYEDQSTDSDVHDS